MARPRIEIDIERVAELAGRGLSQAEICLCLGISENTLLRRKHDMVVLADAIKRGRAVAAEAVSNKLFDMATGGDLGAIIWYEKTRRGLSDRQAVEHSGPAGKAIPVGFFNYDAAVATLTSGSEDDPETPE